MTRFYVVAHVGFWNHVGGINYEDVHQFQVWAEEIAKKGVLPTEETWVYPPGTAFLLLLPRIGGGSYGETFVAIMLVLDLVGLGLLADFGRRRGNYTGVWIWLLGMPLMNALPVLRFDLAPTVLTIAALIVIHRRPNWFGALAGIGAAVKLWPVVVLFGEWDRSKLVRSVLVALAAVGVVVAAAALAFGNPFTLLGGQSGRGVQVETIAAIPWQLRAVVTGTPVPEVLRYGSWQIAGGTAEAVATLLDVAALLVFVAAAIWWLGRDRAIRRGRTDLANATVARDFVFVIVLLIVITSRVFSPQYMIWMLGLSAIVLTAPESRVRRPAWVVLGALVLTTSVYGSATNTVVRNSALLIAAVDAILILTRLLWRPTPALGSFRDPRRFSAPRG